MDLNPQQLEAVQSDHALLVVPASPGSGKTRVLVERIKRLVLSGVRPSAICAITFTNDAANEMRKRLEPKPMIGSVVHEDRRVSYCLEPEPIRLGFCGTLHGLLLRAIRHSPRAAGYSAAPVVVGEDQAKVILEEAVKETRSSSIAKKELVKALAQPLPKNRALTRVESVAAHYQQKLVDAGLIDYDGILRVALGMLQAGAFPFSYEHLLVDEIQDSGAVDALIYELLPAQNKFMVGDDAQSIYGFRGGDPAYLLSLSRRSSAKVVLLEGNYRCGQIICDAANRLISHVPDRIEKETRSVDGHEGSIGVREFPDQQSEIASIAARLSIDSNAGTCLFDDAAVLLRSNALVALYRDGLRAAGIPVKSKRQSLAPLDWSKAQLVVALCSAPENDRLALEYITLASGKDEAARVRSLAAQQMGPVHEVCKLVPDPEFCDIIAESRFMMAKISVGMETMERLDLLSAELPPDATLADLACAMAAQQPEQEEGAGVHVGTIHSAKGREWSSVYLPAFEQGVIPAKRDIDEERRLAFVAITRAKNLLTISYCKERPDPFRHVTEPAVPSQLIAEAGL